MDASDRWTSRSILAFLAVSSLVLLGIVGLISTHEYNLAPVSIVIEIIIIILGAFAVINLRMQLDVFYFFLFFLVYLFSSTLMAYSSSQAHSLDIAQAQKFLYYKVIFLLTLQQKIFRLQQISMTFWILVTLAILKYTYSSILNLTERLGSRPGLFSENNFELVFFLGLFVFLHTYMSKRQFWVAFIALSILTVLAGSRSAIICFLVVSVFLEFPGSRYQNLIRMAVFGILSLAALYVFLARGGTDVSATDRAWFLELFLWEMEIHGLWSWLIGTYPITPLSASTCDALRPYDKLLSFNGDSTCYSVIFHAFTLRIIFDHGLILFSALLASYLFFLRRKLGCDKRAISIIAIVTISGFSVSGFNSFFAALLLIILVSTEIPEKRLVAPSRITTSNLANPFCYGTIDLHVSHHATWGMSDYTK
jgi:hypothetical protein